MSSQFLPPRRASLNRRWIRHRCLRFEPLEMRLTLDAVPDAAAWSLATNLTISFAPDGTDIAGHPSLLHQRLDAVADSQTWESAVLQALQTWMTILDTEAS